MQSVERSTAISAQNDYWRWHNANKPDSKPGGQRAASGMAQGEAIPRGAELVLVQDLPVIAADEIGTANHP